MKKLASFACATFLVVATSVWPADGKLVIRSAGGSAMTSCEKVTEVCVTLERIQVYQTPNDPGSHEEWDMVIGFPPIFYTSFRVKPKDEFEQGGQSRNPYGPFALDQNVNKKVCRPIWDGNMEYIIGGHEEDLWPNRNDPIPTARIEIEVRCGTGVDNPSESAEICKADDDKERFACYKVRGVLQ